MKTDSTLSDSTRASVDPLEVCTLPPNDLGERLAWIRSEILVHATGSQRKPDAIAWELEDAPGLATKLDQLVALERECCSGIVFEHGPTGQAGKRRLQIAGIDPEAPVFAALQLDEPRRGSGRIAKAAGLGALASLIVCCVLPVAAVALLGAAAAAPFASLDRPLVIAGAAALFGTAAFAWQGRRRAPAGTGAGCGTDC